MWFKIWPKRIIYRELYQLWIPLSLRKVPPKKRNPLQSIGLYWADFQSLDSHWNLIIFKKILSKSCSSWHHASFDTFWIQIDWIRYDHCTDHFVLTILLAKWCIFYILINLKRSIFLNKSVNLDSKGVKRIVNYLATISPRKSNFCRFVNNRLHPKRNLCSLQIFVSERHL